MKNEIDVQNIIISDVPEVHGQEDELESVIWEIIEKEVRVELKKKKDIELRKEDVDCGKRIGKARTN